MISQQELDKFFKKYDDGLPQNAAHANFFAGMLIGAGWTREAGDFPGIFDDKMPGHRCLWSCRWSTRTGTIEPDNVLPVEEMTTGQLLGECSDILYRRDSGHAAQAGRFLVEWQTGDINDPGYWLTRVTNFVRDARQQYQDYVCHWSMPRATMHMLTPRPSWANQQELLESWEASGGFKG